MTVFANNNEISKHLQDTMDDVSQLLPQIQTMQAGKLFREMLLLRFEQVFLLGRLAGVKEASDSLQEPTP